MSILRSMTGGFDYGQFRAELKKQQFSPQQKSMLNLRLALLESCLDGGDSMNRASSHFRKGQLTIVE